MMTYPQANRFNNVLKIVFKIAEHPEGISRKDLSEKLNWHPRAINYHLHAACLLNLIKQEKLGNQITYKLTDKMVQTIQKDTEEQIYDYIKSIMSIDICKEAVRLFLKSGQMMTTEEILNKMKEKDNTELSPATLQRRASTLSNWSQWVAKNIVHAF